MPDAQGSVGEAIREAAGRLSATSDTARLDAEVLMAHALGISRQDLLLHGMAHAAPAGFAALVERRLAHEPVAYITGVQEFYGIPLAVTPAVLIPRADSETLVEAARARFADHAPRRVIDLGTGSGALLVAALSLWPGAEGIGIDRSPEACSVARRNAAGHRERILERDWSRPGWADDLGRFDLALANPPYVEDGASLDPSVRGHEPAGALFAGPDGLDAYRVLVPQVPGLLAPGGVALVEIGATQADAVMALAAANGLSASLHRDLAGRPRAIEMAA